jgi:elongation factor P
MPLAADVKRGHIIEVDGKVYVVREINRSAPTGRGTGTIFRFKLNHVVSKQRIEASYLADDLIKDADFARRDATLSYREADAVVFMDQQDYSQYSFSNEDLGEQLLFLIDDMQVMVLMVDGAPVAIELPASVIMTVEETPPPMRSASATSRTKPAKFATGLEIQVPEYIESGEQVKILTATQEFAGRA